MKIASRQAVVAELLRATVAAALLAIAGPSGGAAVELADYLPSGTTYDPEVPKPADTFGFEIGEWHVRPELLDEYARVLATASDRVRYELQGRTHEHRAQPLLIVTSPQNHARLDEIRERHVALTDPATPRPSDAELRQMPVVVLLGFSIHGNEPSGANASMLAAYHLAAARDGEVPEWLERAVILIDPSFNPDGLARFAHWANMHRGEVLVGDPNHREHTEPFPSGRTNHYWFDLNRDWLPLQHPESRNRMRTFHRWKPNLVTDHHEMGTDATFFFQPGVPSRKNPLIPQGNVDLVNLLGAGHAEVFDRARRQYYSEEGFDDFYPGKGSTYPDLNGAVGVLFEQASSRGHLQESAQGPLPFPFGVENQFLAALSSVRGAVEHRLRMLRHQADFYGGAPQRAAAHPVKAYVLDAAGDRSRARALTELLDRHQIRVHRLARDVSAGGVDYRRGEAWVVPLDQPQHVLARSLLEPLTEFTDSTFYDVSTWTLPMAFGLRHAALDRAAYSDGLLGDLFARAGAAAPTGRRPADSEEPVAYLVAWNDYWAPAALYDLLAAGHRVRVAQRELEVETDDGRRTFDRGTLIVPVGLDGNPPDGLRDAVERVAERWGVDVWGARSGLAASGVDLGSPSLRPVLEPELLLAVGPGVSAYDAGEVWHLLDQRFRIPVSLVELDRIGRIDLGRYSHVVLADGRYSFGEQETEELRRWVRGGGTLIGLEGGAVWADRHLLEREEPESEPVETRERDDGERRAYGDYAADRARQLVSGTIVEVEIDRSHPLAYGYADERLPVFRTSTELLPPRANPYENVAFYADPPRLSGYISEENQSRLAGEPALLASRLGAGIVIQFLDNPNFRAFWYGTNKLFLNAVFFGPTVRHTTAPSTW